MTVTELDKLRKMICEGVEDLKNRGFIRIPGMQSLMELWKIVDRRL